MIRVCVVCGKVFGEKPPYHDRSYTHGICEVCFPIEMRRIKKEFEEYSKKVKKNPKIKIKPCVLAELEHEESDRQYAHYNHRPYTICVSKEIKRIPVNHSIAIILHELGHALGGSYEEDANDIVRRLTGINIRYIRETPWGKRLQYIESNDIKKAKKFIREFVSEPYIFK